MVIALSWWIALSHPTDEPTDDQVEYVWKAYQNGDEETRRLIEEAVE